MSHLRHKTGTLQTVLSTELNSLANGSFAATSGAVSLASGENVYQEADLELTVSFGTAPSPGGLAVWLLRRIDGTNFENANASTTPPARMPDVIIPVQAVTGTQRITVSLPMPPADFKVCVKNDSTGQSFASSGNTLKIRPKTTEIL